MFSILAPRLLIHLLNEQMGLAPKGHDIRRWVLWKMIRSGGRILMTEISALIKRFREILHFLPVRMLWEGAIMKETGREPSSECDHVGALTWSFPASRTVGNKFLLFISHLICGVLLQLPEQTKMDYKLCFACKRIIKSETQLSLIYFFNKASIGKDLLKIQNIA